MAHRIPISAWRAFCRRPCETTFLPVYEESKRLVYTICRRILRHEQDADDAFQLTYTRLLKAARDAAGRRELRGARDPDELIFRYAAREADSLKHRLARRRTRETEAPRERDVRRTPDTPDRIAGDRDERARWLGLVNELPDELRLPIVLHFYDGMPLREIARGVDVPLSSLADRVRRGLEALEPRARRTGLGDVGKALTAIAVTGTLLTPSVSARSVYANAVSSIGSAAAASSTNVALLGAFTMKVKIAAVASLLLLLAVGLLLHNGTDEARLAARHVEERPEPAHEAPEEPRAEDLADDDATRPPVEVPAPATEAEAGIESTPAESPTLVGQVIDAESGDPITGAEVYVERGSDRKVRCDERGFFTLAAVSREELHLAARAPGYAIARAIVAIDGNRTFECTLRMEKGFTLLLRVVDEEGRPLEGVSVTPERSRGYTVGEDARKTDAAGRVDLHGIRRRRPQGISIEKAGYRSQRPREFPIADAQDEIELEVVLEKIRKQSRAITGTITDVDGKPLAGIHVQWTDIRVVSSGGKQGRDLVRTAADGTYYLEFDHDGSDCFLGVFAAGWTPVLTKKAELGTPEEPAVLDFVLAPGRRLEGRVVDEDGASLEDVRVDVSAGREFTHVAHVIPGAARKTRTARDGTFTLDDVPETPAVELWKSGYSSTKVYDVSVDEPVELVLKVQGAIPGRVVDDENGEPVAAFNIRLTRGSYWVRRGNPGERFTDPDGRFVLKDLYRDMEFDFVVEADGYAPTKVKGVIAEPLKRAEELIVRLEPARAADGVTVDAATGLPLAGVRVIHAAGREREPLWLEESWRLFENCRWLNTDSGGAFHFTEGRAERLQFTLRGYQRRVIEPNERPAFLQPDGRLRVPLELAATVRVRMTEHPAFARAPEASLVRRTRDGDRERTSTVRHAVLVPGEEHAWDTVAPGEYEVVVKGARPAGFAGSPPWFRTHAKKAAVGEAARFAVGGKLGEGVYSGRLREADGSVLAHDVRLTLRPKFEWDIATVTIRVHPSEGDRFYFPGLGSGLYGLELRLEVDGKSRVVALPDVTIDGSREEDLSLPGQ